VAFRVTSIFAKDIAAVFRQAVSTWVHRDIRDEAERARQASLLIHLMAGAVFVMAVLPMALLPYIEPQQLVPAVLIATAVPLLLVGFLAQTGRASLTAGVALCGAAIGISALAYWTGALASPFLFWTLILPLEAVLLGKSRGSLVWGGVAMIAVIGIVAGVRLVFPQEVLLPGGGETVGSTVSIAGLMLYGIFAAGGFVREQSQTAPMADAGRPETVPILNRLPGLITFHDRRAVIQTVHGSDARELLKYVGDLSGNRFVEHIHVSDRIDFLQAVDQLRTGEDTRTINVRMRSQLSYSEEDQFRHWSVQLVALREDDDRFSGFIAQSRDITAEMELRRSYVRKVGEAEAANEAKTRFLAAVSHELRTPLNAILGFSDILTSELCSKALDETQAEYVGLIRQSGQHLLAVINSILDLSKIDAGRYELNLEPFDIREAIRDCEAMLGQQARDSKIVLNTRVAKGHITLMACRRSVQQVLINLMANAIKFTDDNGVVTVDAADHDGFTRISVSDTGIGMSETDLQKVGAPFVQVETHNARQYEGTGLGLSLVKGLVDLHDGRFAIESSPGVGTTVTIDLPIDGPHDSEMDEQPASKYEFPPRLSAISNRDTEEVHDQAKTA
jgi:cell cycle sensor histidine kinase DivJ